MIKNHFRAACLFLLVCAMLLCSAAMAEGTVLRMATGYNSTKTGIAFGYPAHKSTVVPLEDGRKNYWRDANGDYFVPKYALEEIVRFL